MEEFDYTFDSIGKKPIEKWLELLSPSNQDSLEEFLKFSEEQREFMNEQAELRKPSNMEILCYLEELVAKFPHLSFGQLIEFALPGLNSSEESTETLKRLRKRYDSLQNSRK